MKFLSKFELFYWRKYVWKCRLRNVVNFVSASMCWVSVWCRQSIGHCYCQCRTRSISSYSVSGPHEFNGRGPIIWLPEYQYNKMGWYGEINHIDQIKRWYSKQLKHKQYITIMYIFYMFYCARMSKRYKSWNIYIYFFKVAFNFDPVWLEIWWMTLKNNGVPLLFCF